MAHGTAAFAMRTRKAAARWRAVRRKAGSWARPMSACKGAASAVSRDEGDRKGVGAARNPPWGAGTDGHELVREHGPGRGFGKGGLAGAGDGGEDEGPAAGHEPRGVQEQPAGGGQARGGRDAKGGEEAESVRPRSVEPGFGRVHVDRRQKVGMEDPDRLLRRLAASGLDPRRLSAAGKGGPVGFERRRRDEAERKRGNRRGRRGQGPSSCTPQAAEHKDLARAQSIGGADLEGEAGDLDPFGQEAAARAAPAISARSRWVGSIPRTSPVRSPARAGQ